MEEPCPPPARRCPVRVGLPRSSKPPKVGSPSAYRNENVEQLAGRPLGQLGPGVLGLQFVTHVRGLPLRADSADGVCGIALQRDQTPRPDLTCPPPP